MESGIYFDLNLRLIGITCGGLLVFGVAYNAVVAYLERKDKERGYTAFLVVFGNLVTVLAMIPLIGLTPALLILFGFACSGLPMTIGSMWRHTEARLRERQAQKDTIAQLVEGNQRTSLEILATVRSLAYTIQEQGDGSQGVA